MNSTSRVQPHSSTILKNFFITGLSQETLRKKVDEPLNKQFHIKPEILFSMYSEESEMVPYMKFVFPDLIDLTSGQNEQITPKFFTFMATDAEGVNTYFHCLTFSELFYSNEIKIDFEFESEKKKENYWKNVE